MADVYGKCRGKYTGPMDATVDDKILHQLIGSLSHYLQGFISFIYLRWCRISSINSMGVEFELYPP